MSKDSSDRIIVRSRFRHHVMSNRGVHVGRRFNCTRVERTCDAGSDKHLVDQCDVAERTGAVVDTPDDGQ